MRSWMLTEAYDPEKYDDTYDEDPEFRPMLHKFKYIWYIWLNARKVGLSASMIADTVEVPEELFQRVVKFCYGLGELIINYLYPKEWNDIGAPDHVMSHFQSRANRIMNKVAPAIEGQLMAVVLDRLRGTPTDLKKFKGR